MTNFFNETAEWDTRLNFGDIENKRFQVFEDTMLKTKEEILHETSALQSKYGNVNLAELLECIDQIDFETIQAQNKELERNNESLSKHLEEQEKQFIALSQDNRLKAHKVKDIHDTFLRAKAFYKKELNTYFVIESYTPDSSIVLIQFFRESRCKDDNYTVKLSRDTKSQRNELLETCPKLANFVQLQKRLAESNDVAGLLCCIRKSFIHLRKEH